jgi:hypothetical protein
VNATVLLCPYETGPVVCLQLKQCLAVRGPSDFLIWPAGWFLKKYNENVGLYKHRMLTSYWHGGSAKLFRGILPCVKLDVLRQIGSLCDFEWSEHAGFNTSGTHWVYTCQTFGFCYQRISLQRFSRPVNFLQSCVFVLVALCVIIFVLQCGRAICCKWTVAERDGHLDNRGKVIYKRSILYPG